MSSIEAFSYPQISGEMLYHYASCLVPASGECYLMEWSDWSSCVSICVKDAGVDFGSVQVRSRAVLAQEPENLQLCPDQAWESQPCTGECLSLLTVRGFDKPTDLKLPVKSKLFIA